MRSRERREIIERLLREEGEVSVADLAPRLGASAVSIRRDLTDLAARGIARRTHGGAVRMTPADPTLIHRITEPDAAGDRREHPVVGLVVPTPDYYFSRILEGIRATASREGVRLVLAVSDYDAERERSQIEGLVAAGAKALIVTPAATAGEDPTTYDLLLRLNVPVVVMERPIGDRHHMLNCVRTDHALGARLALQHLHAAGHRGISLVTLSVTPTSRFLARSFEEAASVFDESSSGVVRLTHRDLTQGDEAFQRRADLALDKCLEFGSTAVIVHPDIEAVAVAEQARLRGIDVPGGLSVIAYDDELAGLADPPLDAIAPQKDAVGSVALAICMQRMRLPIDATPVHVTLPPKLHARGSVAAPRAEVNE